MSHDGGSTKRRKVPPTFFKCHVFQLFRVIGKNFFVRGQIVGTGFAYISAKAMPRRNRRPHAMALFVATKSVCQRDLDSMKKIGDYRKPRDRVVPIDHAMLSEGGSAMHSLLGFLGVVILLLAIGCAAPMSKVVATRQDGMIDQQLFKEDDDVWVSYRDEDGTIRKTRGTVIYADGDSVRLSRWREDPVGIEYCQINTLSRPVKHLWFMGVSTGRFWAPAEIGDIPIDRFTTWVGLSPRYAPYSNYALEANFLMGRGKREFSTWIGMTLNTHWYTVIPRTYLFFGGGLIWSKPTEEYKSYLSKFDEEPQSFIAVYRWGFGLTNPISEGFNVRLETETGFSTYVGKRGRFRSRGETAPILGLRIYFERRVR